MEKCGGSENSLSDIIVGGQILCVRKSVWYLCPVGPPILGPAPMGYAEDLPVSASNSYAAPKGRVGPVYTFVKTDPEANFKWGVRHVAGSQYGK